MKVLALLLAYAPGTRLTREGLGRYLTAFLTSASKDRRIVMAIPSWSRKYMRDLLENAGLEPSRVEIVGPKSRPILLSIYEGLKAVAEWVARRRGLRRRGSRLLKVFRRHLRRVAGLVAATRNPILLVALLIYLLSFSLLGAIVGVPLLILRSLPNLWSLTTRALARSSRGRRVLSVGQRALAVPQAAYRSVVRRMFDDMHRREMELIATAANAVEGIPAWYSPTAFWSTGRALTRPRLICVPDVVYTEFPVVFSEEASSVEIAATIERVLNEGTDFVTYSERTKRAVLVEKYGVSPDRISVVRHAPMSLLRHIDVLGYPNVVRARRERSQHLLASALGRSVYPQPVASVDFRFIFYPTQFRPSKNVLTLLRAYLHLRSAKLFGQKLILTGDPYRSPEINQFIRKNRLEIDVLFLKDLTEAELSACYHLADLAVTTSISEGGMPFTFTEALSVFTPVVMGDIEVTREIITDPDLAAATLFDPYDWRAVAAKIEWGIEHRAELLELQQRFYDDVLAKRSWDNVVDEHLALIDAIGSRATTT